MRQKRASLFAALLGLTLIESPILAIDRVEVIRLCKKARSFTMCMREFEGVRFNKRIQKKPTDAPIKIRVIPYKG
ncbi:hypothetical protein [Prochlorococcus marinus]|uniref:Uncharacterized protein n=1 Tax=Prochlorococcus marinus (strain MIT 9211) TaxID=93059 RepID=A9BAA8_PROM4|nr:hypothetical protein [Prochlorococcus marinus]ABX08770.1 Hypothetical protein P9211_08391 [Prochlorococcus marinus str. MIT 9211]